MATVYKALGTKRARVSEWLDDAEFEGFDEEEEQEWLGENDVSSPGNEDEDEDDDDDEDGDEDEGSELHDLEDEGMDEDKENGGAPIKPTTTRTTPIKTTGSPSLTSDLRNRVLMLTSRGVSFRHRHLLNDLSALLPHTLKDTKLDTKSNNNYNSALNGLADLHSCNYIFFLEARKQAQDLYLWLAKAPNGPTIKFSVDNVHTMGELGFGGNCLKGGRGVVVFDRSFDDVAETPAQNKLIREMLRGVFCVPKKGVRGLKPFIDRIVGVYGLDDKIWIRVYEIRETDRNEDKEKDKGMEGMEDLDGTDLPKGAKTDIKLIEVGPRMVLTPIVVLEGSFGGAKIFENRLFVSGSQVRREKREQRAGKYARRKGDAEERLVKKKTLGLESGVKRKRGIVDDRNCLVDASFSYKIRYVWSSHQYRDSD